MPSRNTVRKDQADSYYHVYARGISKADIFQDATDKEYFLYLLARHLSIKSQVSTLGYAYPHFRGKVELLSYCLMNNHFHLLFYQVKQHELSKLMQSIMVAYTVHFNRRYGRTGPLFESRFRASLIDHDDYLAHISRYIHLNPRSWKYYPYSSLRYIRHGTEPEWLQTERILVAYSSRKDYLEFVADYQDQKKILDSLKSELADW